MKCQRCGKDEGEYLCSVCNRVVCSNCKMIDQGKIYCLDDASKTNYQNIQEKKPKEHKAIKELIYADVILLIGVSFLFYISYSMISGLIIENYDTIKNNFPQLSFIFVLLEYFSTSGLYAILGLSTLLIVLIAILIIKKRRDKNI